MVKVVCDYKLEHFSLQRGGGKVSGNNAISINDQSLTLAYSVCPRDPAYTAIFQVLEQHGQKGGTRAYLWSKRASQNVLRIYLEDLPEQSHSW